jgi:hypothetical protein
MVTKALGLASSAAAAAAAGAEHRVVIPPGLIPGLSTDGSWDLSGAKGLSSGPLNYSVADADVRTATDPTNPNDPTARASPRMQPRPRPRPCTQPRTQRQPLSALPRHSGAARTPRHAGQLSPRGCGDERLTRPPPRRFTVATTTAAPVESPVSLFTVGILVTLEKFGYSFGFVANMLYMMQQMSPGKYHMTHYAFCTAIMNLVLVPLQMISGPMADHFGYQTFFIIVCFAAIPSLIAAWFAPFPRDGEPPSVSNPT